jgi:Flp pilus assembly protein TadD
MLIAAKAWRLRREARRSIEAGDFGCAITLASRAQELQRTPSGESLRLLGAWLERNRVYRQLEISESESRPWSIH